MRLRHPGDGTPSALTRLRRDRLLLGGLALTAALALMAAQLTDQAQLRLTGQVDAHWRGAYDLLVRASGATTDLETTDGLIEPNFLSYASAGSITLDQLAAVRALPDVAVAAPIGIVGYVSSEALQPQYTMTRFPSQPTVYDLTMTLSTSDGLSSTVLQRQETSLLVGPLDPAHPDQPHSIDTNQGVSGGGDDGLSSAFAALPEVRTSIVAVDPVAEAALLGPQASAFAAFAYPFNRGTVTTADMDCHLSPAAFALLGLKGCAQPAPDAFTPIVPVLVSQTLYTPLSLSLDVQQVGHPLAVMPPLDDVVPSDVLAQAEAAAGPGVTEVGSTTLDVSGQIRPFAPEGDLNLLFPGDPPPPAGEASQFGGSPLVTQAWVPERPAYTPVASRAGTDVPTFRITPLGPVSADGDPLEGSPGASPTPTPFTPHPVNDGVEPSYRTLRTVAITAASAPGPDAPTGTRLQVSTIGPVDLAALLGPTDPLAYVPLGAYDPPATRLVAGPDGAALADPVTLHPTLDPAGFIDTPPLAITDLLGGTLLRGSAPIDAIRVRVAGLSGFDAAAEARVERVADAIRALGLDVQIVAGASPQPVELYVPDYVDGPSGPATADLGYVAQSWTTLGAAQRVETGLGEVDVLLLLAGLAAAVLLGIGLQLSRAATRTREVAVLRAAGWSRPRILRWLIDEALLAGLVIALVATLTWWLTRASPVALGVGLALAAILPVAAAGGAVVALRTGGRAAGLAAGDVWTGLPARGPWRVRGPLSLGTRSAVARPLRTLTAALALALAATAVVVGALGVAGVAARVGPTALAGALSLDLRPTQLVLLALAGLGALATALLLLRLDVLDRRPEFVSLAAAGWTPRRVAWSLRAQRAVVAILAAVLAAGLGAVMGPPLALTAAGPTALLAALAAASVVLWGGLIARPRARSEAAR